MSDGGKSGRVYSRLQSKQMFERISATKLANAEAEREEARRRQTDPLEIAKVRLRRRGWNVYSQGAAIMVGNLALSPAEVLAFADRHAPISPQGGLNGHAQKN